MITSSIDRMTLLKLTYKIINRLTDHQLHDLLFLFNNVVFNVDYYSLGCPVTRTTVDSWNRVYLKFSIEQFLNNNQVGARQMIYGLGSLNVQISFQNFSTRHIYNFDKPTVLPRDWPCIPLLEIYKCSDGSRRIRRDLPEKELVETSLLFFALQNINKIDVISPTEQLIYTMIAFLGRDNSFLESPTNEILTKFVHDTFATSQTFDFAKKFNGEATFSQR